MIACMMYAMKIRLHERNENRALKNASSPKIFKNTLSSYTMDTP